MRIIITVSDKNFKCLRCGTCCYSGVELCPSEVKLLTSEHPWLRSYIVIRYQRDQVLGTRPRYVLSPRRRVDSIFLQRCPFFKYVDNVGYCTIYDKRPNYCRAYPLFMGYLRHEDTLIVDVLNCPGTFTEGASVDIMYVNSILRKLNFPDEYLKIIPNISPQVPLDNECQIVLSPLHRRELLNRIGITVGEILRQVPIKNFIKELVVLPLKLYFTLRTAKYHVLGNTLYIRPVLQELEEIWSSLQIPEDTIRELYHILYSTLMRPYLKYSILKLPDVFHREFVSAPIISCVLEKLYRIQVDEIVRNRLLNYITEVLSRVPTYFAIHRLPTPIYTLIITATSVLILLHMTLRGYYMRYNLEREVVRGIWISDVLGTGLISERGHHLIPQLLNYLHTLDYLIN